MSRINGLKNKQRAKNGTEGGPIMFISGGMLIILFFAKLFLMVIFAILNHIVIADGVMVGVLTYATLYAYVPIPNELKIAIAVLAMLLVITLSKWKVSFAIVAILGSLMWAFLAMEIFSQHMQDHIVISIILVLFNLGLHVASREKLFNDGVIDLN